MIKKCISLFLTLVLLFSVSAVGVTAAETEKYGHINAYLIDEKKYISSEVMAVDKNLYVNAEFYKNFGFEVKIKDSIVIIANISNIDLPKGAIGFYYEDVMCCRVNEALTEYYKAPFETVKNDKGAWIPFEYSMTLLNGSMLVNEEDVLFISSPKQGLLDVLHNISCNWQTYSFDYASEFGYDKLTENFLSESSHLVNILDGLIKFDGASWASFINSNPTLNSFLGDLGYDAKYGKEVAQMVCTNSSEELLDAVDAIDVANDILSEDGALAEIFDDLRSSNEVDLGNLLQQSQEALKNIEKTNDGVSEYNRIYAQLEKALVKSDFLEIGDAVGEAQNALGNVTSGLKLLASIAEFVSYYNEFKNRDLFAVESFVSLVDELPYITGDVSFYTKTAMKAGAKSFKSNATTYSMGNFILENIDDLVSDGINLCTKANIALLAWDLVSSICPFISDSLSAADKLELSVYTMVVQNEALRIFNQKRTEIISSCDNITEEDLKELTDYAYVYLKLCYVSRNAAIGGIVTTTDEGKEASKTLIDDLNKINSEIAFLLNVAKSAVNKESFACLGIEINNFKQLMNVMVFSNSGENLKNSVQSIANDDILFFQQCDYDLNGIEEAFAITGKKGTVVGGFDSCQVWFVSSDSRAVLIDECNGVVPHENIKAESYTFFKYETTSGGSGSLSHIFGVKDNVPYELNISKQYMDFSNKSGEYVGLTHDFSDGHKYINNYFIFDITDREFYLDGTVNLEKYLSDGGFLLKGKELANVISNMSFVQDVWNCYSDSNGTFIEAYNSDEIFRIQWNTRDISFHDLTVGNTFSQIKEIFSKKGYYLDESQSRTTAKKYVKGLIEIWILFDQSLNTVTDDSHVVQFQITLNI